MSDVVIAVESVSKRYFVGHESAQRESNTTLRDVIVRGVNDFARKAVNMARGEQIVQGDHVEDFWALKDVSFEVKRGEVLGIIGRNGAGKSTLLKILSRVTELTDGRVMIKGRVASLLGVGTGFHSELTGRENIFLNGAVLGMRRSDIRRRFDEIVEFAEVEKFLDTPVKRYSSGMYLRLAFAVAAHLEPDILIVDEVLAVGDAAFQKKCLGKISEVSSDGRTVLFVSHNMAVVTNICASTIWLEKGSIRQQGPARDIVSVYLAEGMSIQHQWINLSSAPRFDHSDERVRIESLEWLCEVPLQHGQPMRMRVHFKASAPIEEIAIGVGFCSVHGPRLLTYSTDFPNGSRPNISGPGLYSAEFDVDSLPLAPDIYTVDIVCRSGDSYFLDFLKSAFQVEVIRGPTTPGGLVRKGAGVRLASASRWVGGIQFPGR